MGGQLGISRVRNAIKGSRGNISTVATTLACSRQTVYTYLKKYPDLQEKLNQEREELVDMAENKLYALIEEGVLGAVLFTLETMGKKRGWTKRLELTGDEGEDLQFSFSGIPDEPPKSDNTHSTKPP